MTITTTVTVTYDLEIDSTATYNTKILQQMLGYVNSTDSSCQHNCLLFLLYCMLCTENQFDTHHSLIIVNVYAPLT